MISAIDSIENGGREQGVLGLIHVYRRLVNNTHRKRQAQEFFCFFFVSWEPIVCTRSSSEISLSYKIIGMMIRFCNKPIEQVIINKQGKIVIQFKPYCLYLYTRISCEWNVTQYCSMCHSSNKGSLLLSSCWPLPYTVYPIPTISAIRNFITAVLFRILNIISFVR